MTPFFFLAALLPGLYWDQPPATADALKKAGIQRVYVPADAEDAWHKLGFTAAAFDPQRKNVVKLEAPGVQYRPNVASATTSPWVDANGWRLQRSSADLYYYELPAGKAALAAAESYAYARDAVERIPSEDLGLFGRMLAFLRRIDQPAIPALANIGVIDDGSDQMGEVMNLLSRRNLLFRVVLAPDAKYDITVRRSPETDGDPDDFVHSLRQKLGDDRRLVRIYGSEVVIARLTGDGSRARLHLLNYGRRPVEGVRVRIRGVYGSAKLQAFETDKDIMDFTTVDGGTEFTVPALGPYGVVDLKK